MKAIITGAGSGIGRAVSALLAAQKGAEAPQLLLVDRAEEPLTRVAAELAATGAQIEISVGDLCDPAVPARVVDAAKAAFAGLDAIVSNAGFFEPAPLADLTIDQFDAMFAIHARAAWLLGVAARPMLAQSRGAIVATSSIAATHPTPPMGAYSASKAALVMMIKQMALEWGPDGIRCNCVAPGPTVTGMTAQSLGDEERRARRGADIPLGRVGTADDLAQAIVFLLSPEAAFITGVELPVDGGLSVSLMRMNSGSRPA